MDDKLTLRPLAEVALARRETREIVLRKVQRGEIIGRLVNGRWLAEMPAAPGASAILGHARGEVL